MDKKAKNGEVIFSTINCYGVSSKSQILFRSLMFTFKSESKFANLYATFHIKDEEIIHKQI
jgi:hypothetical protein